MYLSVIIPLYNEAPVITSTLDRLMAVEMPAFITGTEVIVVDDCSTDGSGEVIRGYRSPVHELKLITLDVNTGKGGAVAEGIRMAQGELILIQDADLELNPEDIPGLLKKLYCDDLDIVSGTRFRGKSDYPVFAVPAVTANILFSIAASALTLRRVTDLTCGYKLFRKSLYDSIMPTEKGFGFETELMMKSLKDKSIKYGERKVSYTPRKKEEGKKIRLNDGFHISGRIIRYGLSGRRWRSSAVIAVLLVIMLFNMLHVKHWKEEQRVIEWDAISYYAYLPATLIYNDPSLSFIDGYQGEHAFIFWPEKSPTGKYVIKTTMGLAVLWSPFFIAGHATAFVTGADTGGYSPPYKFFLLIATLIYLLIGLIYLRKILLRWNSDLVTALTVAAFVAATNMYWYSLFQATMAHIPGFALITAFIWYSIRWHDDSGEKRSITLKAWHAARLGLLLGMISLIRPTNAIIVIVFLLYGIKSWNDTRQRVKTLFLNTGYLFIMAAAVVAVWLPQMAYWKEMTGQWLFFSYGSDERFFFADPAIIKGLFGFRKGLFIYTPLLIFAFAGIVTLWKSGSPLFAAIAVFVPLNIYLILSWWCWWYGGGFGQRAFIDSYALMAVSTAALLTAGFSSGRKWAKGAVTISFMLLFTLGIFNNQQYYHGAIHWDSMTRRAYFNSFGRVRPSAGFYDLLQAPDYEAAKKGADR